MRLIASKCIRTLNILRPPGKNSQFILWVTFLLYIDQVSFSSNSADSIDKYLITKEAYWGAQLSSFAPSGFQ